MTASDNQLGRLDPVMLHPSQTPEAARLLTDAFVDDPALVASGPDRRALRWRVLNAYHERVLRDLTRVGAPQWCVVSAEGALEGVSVTLPDHVGSAYPISAVWEGVRFLRAGPASSLRRAYQMVVTERGYPRMPHLLLLFLAVRADVRARGIGRALLQRVIEDAVDGELPLALDTTRASNVDYYRRFGFELSGEASLLRGARVWFMVHAGHARGHGVSA